MQKIIYILLGIVLVGGLIFGGLYINGNYNDKSEISSTSQEIETRDETKERVSENKKMGNEVVAKDKVIAEEEVLMKKEVVTQDIKKEVVTNTFLKTGSFNKIDSAHYASGEVKVTSDGDFYYLNFQDNFSSANGPDLFVYLSSEQNYKDIAIGGVDTSKTLNIGKLKNISGIQSYKVSKLEFEKYSDSVIIWCKDFAIQFSRAELK